MSITRDTAEASLAALGVTQCTVVACIMAASISGCSSGEPNAELSAVGQAIENGEAVVSGAAEGPAVAIRRGTNGQSCGGVLIRRNVVLTAAHCVRKKEVGFEKWKTSEMSVCVSPTSSGSCAGQTFTNVSQIYVAPGSDRIWDFAKGYAQLDWALLKLANDAPEAKALASIPNSFPVTTGVRPFCAISPQLNGRLAGWNSANASWQQFSFVCFNAVSRRGAVVLTMPGSGTSYIEKGDSGSGIYVIEDGVPDNTVVGVVSKVRVWWESTPSGVYDAFAPDLVRQRKLITKQADALAGSAKTACRLLPGFAETKPGSYDSGLGSEYVACLSANSGSTTTTVSLEPLDGSGEYSMEFAGIDASAVIAAINEGSFALGYRDTDLVLGVSSMQGLRVWDTAGGSLGSYSVSTNHASAIDLIDVDADNVVEIVEPMGGQAAKVYRLSGGTVTADPEVRLYDGYLDDDLLHDYLYIANDSGTARYKVLPGRYLFTPAFGLSGDIHDFENVDVWTHPVNTLPTEGTSLASGGFVLATGGGAWMWRLDDSGNYSSGPAALWDPYAHSQHVVALQERYDALGALSGMDAVLDDSSIVTFPYTASGLSSTPSYQGLPKREDFAVFTSEWASINDRAVVHASSGGQAAVAGMGAWPYGTVWPTNYSLSVSLGTDVTVQEVWSKNVASLRDRAAVVGSIHTTAEMLDAFPNGYSCQNCSTNTVGGNVTAVELASAEWNLTQIDYDFPSVPSQWLHPVAGTLTSNHYDNVVLDPNVEVWIAPGVYSFNSLILEPGSRIEYDSAAGDVYLLVRDVLVIRGQVADASQRWGHLFMGYWGTQDVWVNESLGGTLVAPNALVELASNTLSGQPHRGAVFANAMRLHQDGELEHHPFQGPWPGDTDWPY